MTLFTSRQSSDANPSRFGIKGNVVDLFSNVTRPPCFCYFHCFVDLVLECFKVENCSWGWGIIIGSDVTEHWVLGFKGGCEVVATEVEPPLFLAVINHFCVLSTAKNGFIELGVVEWFLETVS